MKYNLTVDTREPPEIAEMFAQHPQVELVVRAELPDGDIAHGDLLVERKTLADFINGWRSGHVHDQIARLRDSGKKCVLVIYRAPYEFVSQADFGEARAHADTLNLVLPVFFLSKVEDFPGRVMKLVERAESGEYFQWFRQPCVQVFHSNPVICYYASLPGVGAKLGERIFSKYPAPRAFMRAVEENGSYLKDKWKSRAAWEREAWFADVDGIGADKAERLAAFLMDGVVE